MKELFLTILLVIFLAGNIFVLRLPYVPPERWITIDTRITEFEAVDTITKIIKLDQEI
jgi:hypothetical protein